MIRAKISSYFNYLPTQRELEELKEGRVEDFISFLKKKYSKFEVDKIMEKNNLYFDNLKLVIEKTINKVFFRMQKYLIKFSKIERPSNFFLLKYFYYYILLDDLKLVLTASQMKLNEEERKELSAHIVSEKLVKYTLEGGIEKLFEEIGFKENYKDEIEGINKLTNYILKKLKRYGKGNKVIDAIIAYYNYQLQQKEKLLKINLKDFYIGKKTLNEKKFTQTVRNLIRKGDEIESLLAFLVYLNIRKKDLIKILNEKI